LHTEEFYYLTIIISVIKQFEGAGGEIGNWEK
jgi:hypothetical protein